MLKKLFKSPDHSAVMAMINQDVNKAGGQSAYARQIDVSPTFISNVLKGVKRPTDKMLARIGIERLTVYRWK